MLYADKNINAKQNELQFFNSFVEYYFKKQHEKCLINKDKFV